MYSNGPSEPKRWSFTTTNYQFSIEEVNLEMHDMFKKAELTFSNKLLNHGSRLEYSEYGI